MRQTNSNEWLYRARSVPDGTAPVAAYGTAVTPAENAYGNYAEMINGSNITRDCFEIDIIVAAVSINAAARNCIVTIGMDPSGGTSYTDTIVNLLCGQAAAYSVAPMFFRFPLRVAAGTSIAAKASVNSATLTDIAVSCVLRGAPTRPDLIRWGTYVQTFGATVASSSGTAFTPGTASEGAYVQVGSALTRPLFYFDFGFGLSSATVNVNALNIDVALGDATNKRVIIENSLLVLNVNEGVGKYHSGAYVNAAIGDLLYVRGQTGPATATANYSACVYGVGG